MPLPSLTRIRNLISEKRRTDPRLYDALDALVNDVNKYMQITDALISTLQDALAGKVSSGATILWSQVDKTGSSLADLATRSASDLSSGVLSTALLPTIPDGKLAATYTQALTLSNAANVFRGAFQSTDGSSGQTTTFNPTAITSMTFKNGILTAHS